MIHSELSPPASNEESVNSPRSDPPSVETTITSMHQHQSSSLSSSNASTDFTSSPKGKDYNFMTSPYNIQKGLLHNTDVSSPNSSIFPLKSPDSTSISQSSPESSTVQIDVKNKQETRSLTAKVDIKTIKSSSCVVCGDKAEKEHFHAIVCDSCRGFFKRALKNNRKYTCVSTRDCPLTKKTRNHCQSCRLTKCYKVGMSKEAVELELARDKKEKLLKKKQMTTAVADSSTEVSSSENQILTVDLQCISNAELFVDPKISNFVDVSIDPIRQLCLAADKQLASLAEWAKRLPHFTELSVLDQVKLLQWNWPELLIGGFCYRSSAVSNGILLSTGLHLSRENLQKAGVGTLVNKLFTEVINAMKKLQIDVSEWGCLRAIMLFAPDTKELGEVDQVETIRERYIATLCQYVKKTYPDDPNRLAHLLLRLPPLKAIALQVLEHLFFFKLIGDVPIDTFLLEMLDVDNT